MVAEVLQQWLDQEFHQAEPVNQQIAQLTARHSAASDGRINPILALS